MCQILMVGGLLYHVGYKKGDINIVEALIQGVDKERRTLVVNVVDNSSCKGPIRVASIYGHRTIVKKRD